MQAVEGRSKAPWLFAAASALFLTASLFDFLWPWIREGNVTRHHYLRASIDLMLGLYCGLVSLRIRAKEKRMEH